MFIEVCLEKILGLGLAWRNAGNGVWHGLMGYLAFRSIFRGMVV